MIKIIYEDNHLLVVEKGINIPVQEDSSHDLDLLTMLKNDLKIRYHKPGDVYLGLVHRLDRPVGGVMVFAKTSKCASRLCAQIRMNQFQKIYHAIVIGDIYEKSTWCDYIIKDSKTNISSIVDQSTSNAKKAILSYHKLQFLDGLSLVEINLETGRSHQIRVQFKYHGYPLYGDQKYNPQAHSHEQLALWATSLSFNHPITNERLTFTSSPPNSYPWCIFN